jgi:hypothetical protein
MKIIFNEQVALEVFNVLGKAWRKKEGIFRDIVLPQDRYPAIDNPREYANWFFYCALPMRGGIISEEPFKLLWQARNEIPDLFEPEKVIRRWGPEEIEKLLRFLIVKRFSDGDDLKNGGNKKKGYKIDELARSWHRNSLALATHWGSNVLNVFWGVTEFEEAFRRIDYHRNEEVGFRGMRRKIFSLFTIWLQEKGLINIFPTPFPVDFHALRILWASGIIRPASTKKIKPNARYPTLEGKTGIRISEGFVDQIHLWSQRFLAKNNLSHLEINPALWVLSRELCAKHLQNSSRDRGKILFDASDIENNPNVWPSGYTNPCAICPIEKWCQAAIPAAPAYRWGLLVKFNRVYYPQYSLQNLDLSKVAKATKKNTRK